MRGMVLGTATPDLKVSSDGTNFYNNLNGVGSVFAKLLPGESDSWRFWLRNDSVATGDPLHMNLSGIITDVGGDWDDLKEVVEMRVCLFQSGVENNCNTASATGWETLKYWRNNSVDLDPLQLNQGATRSYVMELRIDGSYTNTIAGKTISGLTFNVTGEQVTD